MNKIYSLPDVCCVVVTYNGDQEVIHRIRKYSEFLHVVVVDNGSDAGFTVWLDNVKDIVKIIKNVNNKGIAYALNQGLEYAEKHGFELLLTMDQDSEITKESVEYLIEGIDPEHNIVSVGPNYINGQNTENQEVRYLITSGNLVLVAAAQETGGYDDDLFIDEVDIDFSFNLRKYGYRLFQISGAKMNHKIGEYEQSRVLKIRYLSHSPIRFYYMFRNTLIVAKRYQKIFPNETRKLLLCLFGIDLTKLLFVEKNKCTKLKNAFRGISEGIRYKQ